MGLVYRCNRDRAAIREGGGSGSRLLFIYNTLDFLRNRRKRRVSQEDDIIFQPYLFFFPLITPLVQFIPSNGN